MKTVLPKKIEKQWYLFNAENLVLGKLATKIAYMLQGKNKPIYTPHLDTGDFIIVTNMKKIKLTGNKLENKKYYRHSGYIGNLKEKRAKDILEDKPELLLYNAVKGMLPKNKLRSVFLKKLHIYAGNEHKHEAQKPQELTL